MIRTSASTLALPHRRLSGKPVCILPPLRPQGSRYPGRRLQPDDSLGSRVHQNRIEAVWPSVPEVASAVPLLLKGLISTASSSPRPTNDRSESPLTHVSMYSCVWARVFALPPCGWWLTMIISRRKDGYCVSTSSARSTISKSSMAINRTESGVSSLVDKSSRLSISESQDDRRYAFLYGISESPVLYGGSI